MDLMFKQSDTHNAIKATITKNGDPISLRDCRVLISVSDNVYEDECAILDADNGIVAYPVSKLSDVDGWYIYEFIIEYKDGTREVVPNNDFKKLRIHKRIKEE